ncbi:alpha/beta hydrolase [Desulfuromonas sp. AOP6]|uniref:alpha/beta hydrolase n=1 Tax=Desulfuromonas sp. AOP6 TaxID=1566351 RepID=UPI00127C03D0|nr:alpha/beta hydrolase [Desulfuromonas sp. AOP6]BCA78410.1 hypothetical protein AOP6_0197 [Desulfuromonas sp. AOP6]
MNANSFVPTASPVFRPGCFKKRYQFKIRHLSPPVIVNLREDANPALDSNARDHLRPEEIRYFKENGNNAVIFIHGFNVEYGQYSHHVELSRWGFDTIRNRPMEPKIIYSSKPANTYRDLEVLKNQYAHWQVENPNLFNDIAMADLNGTGAHAWYLHMEDNLNRATGQFDRTNYQKYSRMIHLAWSGDVFALDYMAAETTANKAGFGLVRLVDQLASEGISVNIIAHSLGNRVLLVAMNILGQMRGRHESIAHAFMWQPAVPDTALSNDPERDTSVLRNWNFVHAHRAAKKIVVLYSSQDNILGPYQDKDSRREDWEAGQHGEVRSGQIGGIYRIATSAGVPGTQLFYAPWSVSALYARNLLKDNLPKIEQALHEEIAKDTNGLFNESHIPIWPPKVLPALGALIYLCHMSREMADDAMKTFRALARADYEVKQPRPAMGYGGPEIDSDLFIQRLVREEKILPVDQSLWLFDHSGMKVPSDLLFEKVYQEEIMDLLLSSTGFGAY